MKKQDIFKEVASEQGMTTKEVTQIGEALLDKIVELVASGEKAEFYGFGNFEPRERAARTGRNPATSEVIDIPAKTVPAFKPLKKFKTSVSGE